MGLRLSEAAPLPEGTPDYNGVRLPVTGRGAGRLLRLPSFPRATCELLEQYARAFAKIVEYAEKIAGLPPTRSPQNAGG